MRGFPQPWRLSLLCSSDRSIKAGPFASLALHLWLPGRAQPRQCRVHRSGGLLCSYLLLWFLLPGSSSCHLSSDSMASKSQGSPGPAGHGRCCALSSIRKGPCPQCPQCSRQHLVCEEGRGREEGNEQEKRDNEGRPLTPGHPGLMLMKFTTTSATSSSFMKHRAVLLHVPGVSTFCCKGLEDKYLRLWGPYDLCGNFSTLPVEHENSHQM